MPLTPTADGLRLSVRATPKSSRDEVSGLYVDAEGRRWLRVHVRSAPEKGKANKAVVKLLARETGLAPSSLSVISGAQNRNKVILIEGEPDALVARLQPWLQELE